SSQSCSASRIKCLQKSSIGLWFMRLDSVTPYIVNQQGACHASVGWQQSPTSGYDGQALHCGDTKMSKTWILVAHRSGARLFENRGPGKGLAFLRHRDKPAG